MNGKMLLFGFEDLPSIAAVGAVAQRNDVDMVPVLRTEYNKTLGVLSGLSKPRIQPPPFAGGSLGGRMIVFCQLEDKLDALLEDLRRAGIGPECLKAVLTPHNQGWNAVALYAELWGEHQALNRKR